MKMYKFYWLDGKISSAYGDTVSDAFSSAGYGAGAMAALDFYTDNEIAGYDEYLWMPEAKCWQRLDKPKETE